MSRRNIEEEVNKTLASVEDITKAEASPFLYAKIKRKISSAKEEESVHFMLSWIIKPVPAFAMLLIAFFINIYMVLQARSEKKSVSNKKDVALQVFAREYGIVSYSAYDKTN